jgi:hypothetical protein
MTVQVLDFTQFRSVWTIIYRFWLGWLNQLKSCKQAKSSFSQIMTRKESLNLDWEIILTCTNSVGKKSTDKNLTSVTSYICSLVTKQTIRSVPRTRSNRVWQHMRFMARKSCWDLNIVRSKISLISTMFWLQLYAQSWYCTTNLTLTAY